MNTINPEATPCCSKLITYLPDGGVKIDFDNVFTIDRIVYPSMKVLKFEGVHVDAIEILDVYDQQGYVYLPIRDLASGATSELVQVLDEENKVFVWSIVSYEYIMDHMVNRIMMRYIAGH
ncbi:MAG: hypothetical protein KAR19_20015 [Bacteroidales bacterium]|nr:hypothetical protein [Bacteroidales bacterium]